MSWMDVCWTVMAAACLTLGSVHLLIWNQNRSEMAHLFFALAAYSVVLTGVLELLAMHADLVKAYEQYVRLAHLPLAAMFIALVAFVRLHLHAGRAWLGHLAWGLRVLALIPNFTTGVNVNFLHVDQLLVLETWGGAEYVTPIGVANPWMALPQLSNLLMVAFFIDAAVTAWRGESASRAKILRICLSMGLFVAVGAFWNLAVIVGGIHFPMVVLPAFTGVVVVMGYELGGDVIRAVQLAKDLSASETTLRQTEQRVEDAVVAAGLGLWEWDIVSREVWLSPRAGELLGVKGSELMHQGQLRSRIDPASLQALDAAIGPMSSNGGEFLSEFCITDGQGRLRWLLARGQGELDASQKPFIVRGVLVDNTARREAAVRRDDLAHLSRVALFVELSGSLAHELNQPLTSILSNAQAAQRFIAHHPPNLEEVSESLANIVESDKRAGEIIRRLRAMLRKEPSDFKKVQLNEVVQEVLRIIRSDLMSKGIEVQVDLQADLPLSDGDSIQLQQVLLNVIINASDAMQQNSRDRIVTVRTRSSPDEGAEVSVSDLGTGISAGDLEHIFTPFMTTKATGMGLGLPICNTIIQAHRGRLWATNNESRGATVLFRLPPEGTITQASC